MRSTRTAKMAAKLLACVLGLSSLHQSSHAQRMGVDFINNGRTFDGSRMEFRSPEGYSCRFDNSDRPSVSFGVGVADPQIIPSSYSYEKVYPAYAKDPEPVGGVVVRIPFGKDPDNCDEILKLESNKLSMMHAQDMFEMGLIEEDQLKKVADQVCANILKTVEK